MQLHATKRCTTMMQHSRHPRKGVRAHSTKSAYSPGHMTVACSRTSRNYRFLQARSSLVEDDAMDDYSLDGIDIELPPLVGKPV
ncbi:unnamed protein product [Lasius platythorax]|uniref:Uncharacterized protein n=1 Tax=Lasius platythorax TaxID=488582 RepID=A0AAV2P6T4_9HYME